MKKMNFQAEIMAGHKDDAVEVPFNPNDVWSTPSKSIWKGRKGHAVSGTLNRIAFDESFIVPRQKKFYLLIDGDMERAARVNAGDSVRVSVQLKS